MSRCLGSRSGKGALELELVLSRKNERCRVRERGPSGPFVVGLSKKSEGSLRSDVQVGDSFPFLSHLENDSLVEIDENSKSRG